MIKILQLADEVRKHCAEALAFARRPAINKVRVSKLFGEYLTFVSEDARTEVFALLVGYISSTATFAVKGCKQTDF